MASGQTASRHLSWASRCFTETRDSRIFQPSSLMVELVLALNISVCLKPVPFVCAFDNLKKSNYTKREEKTDGYLAKEKS